MFKKAIVLIFSIFSIIQLSFAQGYDYDEESSDSSKFFVGANIGAYFANKKTAKLYSGAPGVTNFGYDQVLFSQQHSQVFRDYFIYEYKISEDPIEPVYKTTVELGIHAGYRLSNDVTIFLDLNSIQLKYDQFFTIEVIDPNNNTLIPDYRKIPIKGKESRFNLNLGTQISYYNEDETNAYFSLFGNVNGVQMEENYFVINNVEYQILHPTNGDLNIKPGGLGYGGGGGLGLKLGLNEKISSDLYYNLYYTKTNLNEFNKPFGIHHSIGIRIIWN
jgi:hypothetical protein